MNAKSLLFALFFIPFVSLYGQDYLKPSPEMVTAMEKVSFMEGKWKGEGWVQMGPQKEEFIQHETVGTKANGTVMVIDGIAFAADDTSKVVHNAYAVISYNDQESKYVMRAYRADGRYVDADFEVQDDGKIVWGFSHPMAGQIKYTIWEEDGKWIEKGEMSRDGESWMHFFQTSLEKI